MFQDADARCCIPSLYIFHSELAEFRRTRRKVHLLHAARALDDARVEMREALMRELHQIQHPSKGGSAHER